MEHKTFLKVEKGKSVVLRVNKIAKQTVVVIEGDQGTLSLFHPKAQEQLRELYTADHANPNGPLSGKTLLIQRDERGYWKITFGSSRAPEIPFEDVVDTNIPW